MDVKRFVAFVQCAALIAGMVLPASAEPTFVKRLPSGGRTPNHAPIALPTYAPPTDRAVSVIEEVPSIVLDMAFHVTPLAHPELMAPLAHFLDQKNGNGKYEINPDDAPIDQFRAAQKKASKEYALWLKKSVERAERIARQIVEAKDQSAESANAEILKINAIAETVEYVRHAKIGYFETTALNGATDLIAYSRATAVAAAERKLGLAFEAAVLDDSQPSDHREESYNDREIDSFLSKTMPQSHRVHFIEVLKYSELLQGKTMRRREALNSFSMPVSERAMDLFKRATNAFGSGNTKLSRTQEGDAPAMPQKAQEFYDNARALFLELLELGELPDLALANLRALESVVVELTPRKPVHIPQAKDDAATLQDLLKSRPLDNYAILARLGDAAPEKPSEMPRFNAELIQWIERDPAVMGILEEFAGAEFMTSNPEREIDAKLVALQLIAEIGVNTRDSLYLEPLFQNIAELLAENRTGHLGRNSSILLIKLLECAAAIGNEHSEAWERLKLLLIAEWRISIFGIIGRNDDDRAAPGRHTDEFIAVLQGAPKMLRKDREVIRRLDEIPLTRRPNEALGISKILGALDDGDAYPLIKKIIAGENGEARENAARALERLTPDFLRKQNGAVAHADAFSRI